MLGISKRGLVNQPKNISNIQSWQNFMPHTSFTPLVFLLAFFALLVVLHLNSYITMISFLMTYAKFIIYIIHDTLHTSHMIHYVYDITHDTLHISHMIYT